MTNLILSDITVMGPGYCVLGLEQVSPNSYRSLRPLPPQGFAWRDPFPFRRGDCVQARLWRVETNAPHVEDRRSEGLRAAGERLSEESLVDSSKKAEVSASLQSLFDCPVERGARGGRALWVQPSAAKRSVCGCEYENVRFRIYPEPDGYVLRAEMVVCSGERIPSIPIVDRAWRAFVGSLVKRVTRSEPLPLVERFLNRTILPKLLTSLSRFARIGLPRPRESVQCWLMLDSLFPQPQRAWLDLF
jgi:hypothetical protein